MVQTEVCRIRDHYGWCSMHFAFSAFHQAEIPIWFDYILEVKRLNSRDSKIGNSALYYCGNLFLIIKVLQINAQFFKSERLNIEGKNLYQNIEDTVNLNNPYLMERGFTNEQLEKFKIIWNSISNKEK